MNIQRILIVAVAMWLAWIWVFPSETVLVISTCSPSGCEWKSLKKGDFDDNDAVWTGARESGRYAVHNKTGRTLRMVPVGYGGATSKTAFTIPKGWSVQNTRPDYLMTPSPSMIKTSYGGRTTRWELKCW